MAYSTDLRSLHILRSNIQALLLKRRESEAALAAALGFKHRSSLNKFLNNDRAGFQMWRLDRMSAFFGIPVYQLFQPGISPLLERRVLKDRRMGHDRRQGHAHRLAHIPAPNPPRRVKAPDVGTETTPSRKRSAAE